MDIVKNPIIIGLAVGGLTYCYLSHTKNEENSKKKKKNNKTESINLLIPLVIAILAWFIAYAYFEYNCDDFIENQEIEIRQSGIGSMPYPIAPESKHSFTRDVITASSEPREFNLIHTGVTIPKKLPDVLLDVD